MPINPPPSTKRFLNRHAIDDTIAGYAELVTRRVAEGWHPFLATMMFERLPGNSDAVVALMQKEAEYMYSAFLTRAVRRPLAPRSIGHLPILIVAPDTPVGKIGKPVQQVTINDGAHLHGVLVVPPRSRLPVPADEHFRAHQALYTRGRSRLQRVDVRPIEGPVDRVVAYALKGLRRRRFSMDVLLVLPRARSEIGRSA